MKNPKVNYVEYEMEDGEHIALSTAPILLLNLKTKNKAAYKNLSRTLMKGTEDDDIMELYQFVYNTYLCANQDEDAVMTFEEFVEGANQSIQYNVEMVNEMVNPSKKQNSEQPSDEQ